MIELARAFISSPLVLRPAILIFAGEEKLALLTPVSLHPLFRTIDLGFEMFGVDSTAGCC